MTSKTRNRNSDLATRGAGNPKRAIVDSGAEEHIVPSSNAIQNPVEVTKGSILIKSVSGDLIPVTMTGTMTIENELKDSNIELNGVLIAPGATESLISVPKLIKQGYEVLFRQGQCIIQSREGISICIEADDRGLFHVPIKRPDLDNTVMAGVTTRQRTTNRTQTDAQPRASKSSTQSPSRHPTDKSADNERNRTNTGIEYIEGNTYSAPIDSGANGSSIDDNNHTDGVVDHQHDNNAKMVDNYNNDTREHCSQGIDSDATTDNNGTHDSAPDHLDPQATTRDQAEMEEFGIDPSAVRIDNDKNKKKLINLLHERLGHLNFDDVKLLLRGDHTADGAMFKTAISQTPDECPDCLVCKAKRSAFGTNKYTQRATRNNFRFFMDIKGPIESPSRSGAFYYAVLKDDYSRYVYVMFMRYKSELFAMFSKFRIAVEKQMLATHGQPHPIAKLHVDGGGENVSSQFIDSMAALGIEYEMTGADTPEQNAVAERTIGTLQPGANAMMRRSGLPKEFWPYAIRQQARIRNRSPSKSIPAGTTPYELRFGIKPSLRNERVFGAPAYVLDPKASSFDDKAIVGVWLGHSEDRATQIVYSPARDTIYQSAHVTVDEKSGFSTPTSQDRTEHARIRTFDRDKHVFDPALLSWENDEAASGDDTTEHRIRRTNTTPHDQQNQSAIELFSQYRTHTWDTLPEPVHQACINARRKSMPGMSDSQLYQSTRNWWTLNFRMNQRAQHTANMRQMDDVGECTPSTEVPAIVDPLPNTPATTATDNPTPRRSQRLADTNSRRTDTLIATIVAQHLPLHDHQTTIASVARASLEQCPTSMEDIEDWENSPDHVTRLYGRQWRESVNKEISGLEANGCWDVVNRADVPSEAKILKSGHTFKIKTDGTLKTRFVAKGYSQREGIDFHDIYAPVVRMVTIRTILAIANLLDWEIAGMDFVQAFVHGELQETLYMQPPPGSEAAKLGRICRLRKTLYGLKQSAREWSERLATDLIAIGFHRSEEDDELFVLLDNNGRPIAYIAVWVDDCIMACESIKTRDDIWQMLNQRNLEFTRNEVLTQVLNIDINRDRKNRILSIGQPKYCEKMLETFGMGGDDVKPTSTPQSTAVKLDKSMCPSTQDEQDDMKPYPYRKLVGTLLHLTMTTRPDLARAVGELCKYMANPGKKHWEAAKHVLRYVKGTTEVGIVMNARSVDHQWGASGRLLLSNALHVYVDASYADDEKSRSTAGFVAMLAGATVSYKSSTLKDPPTSTAHAEIGAAYIGTQEAIWLVKILGDMGIDLTEAPVIHEDNTAAISHSKDANFHGRLRHLGTKYHLTRRMIKQGNIEMRYLRTEDMCADMFTKALPAGQFIHLRNKLNVMPTPSTCSRGGVSE